MDGNGHDINEREGIILARNKISKEMRTLSDCPPHKILDLGKYHRFHAALKIIKEQWSKREYAILNFPPAE